MTRPLLILAALALSGCEYLTTDCGNPEWCDRYGARTDHIFASGEDPADVGPAPADPPAPAEPAEPSEPTDPDPAEPDDGDVGPGDLGPGDIGYGEY